ncbi:RHS repeat protein, partial [Streptomyces sp. SID11385]|nr:RHS repeat protein [Streptomyces sp. SID11385]
MAGGLAGLLGAGLIGGPVAEAAGLDLVDLARQKPVPTAAAKTHGLHVKDETRGRAWKVPKVAWPKAGVAAVSLPETARARVKADGLPVGIQRATAKAGPSKADVQLLDRETSRRMGIEGMVLAVRPTSGAAGKANVQVDYSAIRGAYGADWASRLTLKQLPDCVLDAPGSAQCGTGETLDSVVNDTAAGTVSGVVALGKAAVHAQSDPVEAAPSTARSATGLSATSGTVLLAATASASGASGDFGATSLAPSSNWSAGGSNGGFSWSYDIDTPEVPGGVEPELSLGYNSQSVDGRTAATNNQANWIGDGWSMEPGYIERR